MDTTRKPPMYREGPYWSRTRAFLRDPLEFGRRHSLRLGPVFETPVPFRRVYIVTGPEEIRQVLQSGHRSYVKSPFYRSLEMALGKGLLTSEGELWKQQRKLVQPVFYKSALEGLFAAMQSEAVGYCDELAARLSDGPQTLDLSLEMMRVTADIVLQTLFSARSSLDRQEMHQMMVELQAYVTDRELRPWLLPWLIINGRHRRFRRYLQTIDNAMYEMIDERQAEEDPPHDLLSLLTHSRDADTGARMERQLIRDELITLFAAGHETSANALTWTLWLLHRSPETLEKLRAEEKAVLNGRPATLADLPQLTYTRQVIDEGMRLYPPAYAVGRQAIHDTEIGEFAVPKDTIVFLSIYALHRRPDLWKDPDVFRPERFADPDSVPDHAYLPFGLGPRKCIGFQFALMEMQMLLPMLVRRFRFSFSGQMPETQPLITLRPKDGMEVVIDNV